MNRIVVFCFVASTLLPGVGAWANGPSHFAPEDVFELEWASDPQISPDGERIVYVRNAMDIMTDRRRGSLWIIDWEGDDHRPLTTEANARSPRWSPDGHRLAYVASEDGSSQIHMRWMDTGASAAITRLTSSPGELVWSPDGRWLAFSMHVPEAPEPYTSLPAKPDGATWAPPAKVITKLSYRADGAGYLEDGYHHLFVLPADGGTPRQLTSGPFQHGTTPSWTPDSKALIFSANRHENWEREPLNTEIYEVRLEDGSLRALTDRAGPDTSPVVSPDGERIAYTGFDDRYQGYQVTKLYVMTRDGEESSELTGSLDRDVQSLVWNDDSSGLYVQYDDRGSGTLAFVPLDGPVRALETHLGGTSMSRPYTGGSFSVGGKGRFAMTYSDPLRPADLAVGASGEAVRPLTSLNEDLLGHKELGAVETITYASSHDGQTIQGWLIHPPGFDPNAGRKYPLILEIHGGPFAAYGPHFAAELQLFAARGYVVLYVNPRGSTSYGEAFGNEIHHAYPSHDYDDLMSGIDYVLERGYVDEDRLYVTGGSGGGVLTAWIVGHTDRFRAAVSAKPVINWYSFVLTSDAYPFFTKYWFPGPPWEHAEHYLERSPLAYVGNVTTPTMLLTGESDYRTPISESEQFYQALQLRGIDTALVRVPEASHGIASRPSHLVSKVQHILQWFEDHGGGE